uniref:Uncharacterized protein n=1 Tax=Zonotrichia albicollis TaxID=44394 RepID=A0A8D2M8F7_ZONAL
MSFFEEAETEETVTCLHLTFYHPGQAEKMMFRCLDFCRRQQLRADDTAKFGRDSSLCRYSLVDTRVSRIQFSLQFYRKLHSSEYSSLLAVISTGIPEHCSFHRNGFLTLPSRRAL